MWRLLLGTMGVKSLVQGLNAAATAGFEPRTVWSEVRRRNRLATAPPPLFTVFYKFLKKNARVKTYQVLKWNKKTPKMSQLFLPYYVLVSVSLFLSLSLSLSLSVSLHTHIQTHKHTGIYTKNVTFIMYKTHMNLNFEFEFIIFKDSPTGKNPDRGGLHREAVRK